MLLDECFMYDYGLVDATEEASHKKEVSDKMCEKALELRAAELDLAKQGPFLQLSCGNKRLSKPRHRPREEAQCAPSPYVPPSARAHPPSAPNRVLFSTALEPA